MHFLSCVLHSLEDIENAGCIKMFSKFIPCAFQGPISILPHESLLGLDRFQVKETWTKRERQKLLDASSSRGPGHQPGQSRVAWGCTRWGFSLLQHPHQPRVVPSGAEPFQITAGARGQGRGRVSFQMDRNSQQGSTTKITKGRSDPQAVNNIQLR